MLRYCPVCEIKTDFHSYTIHPELHYCSCCGCVFPINLMVVPTSKEHHQEKKLTYI